jgi:hypothetical protein
MSWQHRRLFTIMRPSLRLPSFGGVLCASRSEKSTWVRIWRELHADVPAFLERLPRTPFYLSQYQSVVDRYDAGDPEILGLGGVEAHVAKFREILAEVEP